MNRGPLWISLPALLTLLLAACTQTPASRPDTRAADETTIRNIEAQWGKNIQARDLDKETSVYAGDASFLMPGIPIQTGRDTIRALHKSMMADPNLALALAPSKFVVAKSGDLAYTQGAYTLTSSDPKTKTPMTEKGKYVDVYQKQADGSWKVVEDIFNADAPAEPAKK